MLGLHYFTFDYILLNCFFLLLLLNSAVLPPIFLEQCHFTYRAMKTYIRLR